MACHLNVHRVFRDLVDSFDYLSGTTSDRQFGDLALSSSWPRTRQDSTDSTGETSFESSYSQWPLGILSSVSPFGDYAIFAFKTRIVIHASSSTRSNSAKALPSSLECIHRGEVLDPEGEPEIVTAVLCCPVASHRKTSQGHPDWTCFFIGCTTGHFKVITEDGSELLSQQFHAEPIVSVKCRTFRPSRFSNDTPPTTTDELVILYPTAVVLLEGFDLFHNIQSARSSLAIFKAQSSPIVKSEPWTNPRALMYRKFTFDSQLHVSDCDGPIVASHQSTFDQLKTASLLGGFGAHVGRENPVMTKFLAVGSKPFVGFYFASDSQPRLVQTARMVASKLKSALFSFTGFSSPETTTNEPIEGDPLPLRFSVPDKNREAISAVMSPRKNLTAVVDKLGRVSLIENSTGIAVRMWKGYRDAEVAWYEASSASTGRFASFLVIYAPRRGIMEVWATQMGPRVAAFNVSKAGKLINCSNYRSLGINDAVWAQEKSHQHQVLFIDADGTLFSLSVPLHLIDCEKNKRKAEDLHAVGKIRRILGLTTRKSKRPSANDLNSIFALLGEIKTPELLENALNLVLGQHSEESLKKARYLWADQSKEDCDQLIDILEGILSSVSPKSESVSPETSSLTESCCKYALCAKTYRRLLTERQGTSKGEETSWKELLKLPSEEEKRVETLLGCNSLSKVTPEGKNVRFAPTEDHEKLPMALPEFIARFECRQGKKLAEKAESETLSALGETLLSESVAVESIVERFGQNSEQFGISLADFVLFTVKYFLTVNLSEEGRFSRVVDLMTQLLQLLTNHLKPSEDQAVETLKKIHSEVLNSSSTLSPYLIGLICRTVLSRRPKVVEKTPSSEEMEEVKLEETEEAETSWEEVTAEEVGWNLMCNHLSCLAPLSILVKDSPGASSVSLGNYLATGEACVCEALSRWCISEGISVERMREIGLLPKTGDEGAAEEEEGQSLFQHLVSDIKQEFATRLDPDIVLMNCGYEWALKWSETNKVDFLAICVECFDAMDSPALCSRVQSFVWTLFVCQTFAGAATLLERTGCRMPRDQVLKRELSMDAKGLEVFFDFLRRFLALLLKRIGEGAGENELQQEGGVGGRKELEARWKESGSLGKLVAAEQPVNAAVVNNHFLLCFVLESALKFGIKGLKPLSLFSQTSKKFMFSSLTTNVTLSYLEESDTALSTVRGEFLKRLATESIRAMPDFVPGTDSKYLEVEYEKYVQMWVGICVETAAINVGWGDVDDLRRHVVVDLYSRGMDDLGEKESVSVVDKDKLALCLLNVAGKRIGGLARAAEVSAELTPTVSRWIKSLEQPDDWFCMDVPVEVTEKLIGKVMGWMNKEKRQKDAALSDALMKSVKAVRRIAGNS